MMKGMSFSLIVAVAILSTVATGLAAKGNVVGSVTDAAGSAVAGARIRVLDASGQVVASGVSNDAGAFKIPCVEEGDYSVQLTPDDSHLTGDTVSAAIGPEGLQVHWTVAYDKPALARGAAGGGTCPVEGAAAAAGGTTAAGTGSALGGTAAAVGLGGAVVLGGTLGGLAAGGAFGSNKQSETPSQ